MSYPCIEVNLPLLKKNTETIVRKCAERGISVIAVSKVFCGDPIIAEAVLSGGVTMIADSRMKNIVKLQELNCPKTLLRIPALSEVAEVIEYADYSQNSELEVLQQLSKEAIRQNKIHKVILMVDLGDLREGFWEDDVLAAAIEVHQMAGLRLAGIGTNLTCYGAVIPDETNLGKLVALKKKIEANLDMTLEIVSGGNSSSYYLVENGKIPAGINQLRIGEAIIRGVESAFGDRIEETSDEVFILKAEIIELKEKPSIPIGTIGFDAFGNVPEFQDKGTIRRAIIAIGKQDVKVDGMIPLDSGIEILGASSDHTIIDISKSSKNYQIGDTFAFKLDYVATLMAMTSEYVEKRYLGDSV